jgi:hypothetical protein
VNTINDLNQALEQLDAMRAELGPAIEQMNALERAIRDHVLETGETHDRITIRAGYTRISWDNRALAGYAVDHPEIKQFAKTSDIGPSVAISKAVYA